jgi:desulfoferrodoxin-like iron-binding protein
LWKVIINYPSPSLPYATSRTSPPGSRLLPAVPQLKPTNMTNVKEIYLCEICGNKVQVLESGAGQLVCCGQPMKKVTK